VQKSLNTIAGRIEGLLDHIGRATSYVALAIVGLIVINVTLRYSRVAPPSGIDFIWHELCITPRR